MALRILFSVIALAFIIFCINYSKLPNVNDYINAHNFKYPGVTNIKTTFDQDGTYRLGRPEGIVIHETTTTDSARSQVDHFLKHWRKREAYVHAFVDQNEVIEVHTPTRTVWGAGRPANRRYIQVELCEGNNLNEFARGVNNDAIYVASLLHRYHLKPQLAQPTQATWSFNKKKLAKQDVDKNKPGGLGTIWSHSQVSRYLGNTTHTDPDGYFAKYGYSMDQFYQLVCQYYSELYRH